MNSPYRAHPALPQSAADNTIPFPAAAPKPQGPSKLELLVALEGAIRQQPKRSALALHSVNEPRGLVEFDHAFLFRINRNNKLMMDMASSVSRIETQAPMIRAITAAVQALKDLKKPFLVDLSAAVRSENYPFAQGFWSPFLDRKGKCFGGLLFMRRQIFSKTDALIATRLGQTYGHAFMALSPPSLLRLISIPRWAMAATPLFFAALFFIPVPMTSLAPFEVVAKDPTIIAAPIDGAIAEVFAEPNSHVNEGDRLFRFDDTVLLANAQIAQQKLSIAAAKLATAKNGGFTDVEVKRSLAELQSELDLASAEYSYAKELLSRTNVTAKADGLLIFASKSDLIGKPVHVGEKIMEVADAERIEYRADLGVHDSISLVSDGKVKLFLDADPLHPREGTVTEMSYHATEKPGGVLAYTVRIDPTGNEQPERIGLRGTAQLLGEQVSLGFYLFRRPIAALRQYFGY